MLIDIFHYALIAVSFAVEVTALDNGLAITPPMGWISSGRKFKCQTNCRRYPTTCTSASTIKRIANIMVSQGYRSLGYQYVIIDDCWMSRSRDSQGHLRPHKKRFPNGMRALADYVHSLKLKLGLYASAGLKTCEGYPGSLQYLETDAMTFAEWGIDYVKFDACFTEATNLTYIPAYQEFSRLLNKTTRPMVLACNWPSVIEAAQREVDYHVVKSQCNTWSSLQQMPHTWEAVEDSLAFYGNNQDRFRKNIGPGSWADPGVLLVGDRRLTYDQSRTQMVMWSILPAPLLISAELSHLPPGLKKLLQNRYLIELNQQPFGVRALRFYYSDGVEIWSKPIGPVTMGFRTFALAVVNHRVDSKSLQVQMPLSKLGLYADEYVLLDMLLPQPSFDDIEKRERTKILSVDVQSTGVAFVRAVPFF